jgi:hypothetical protein
VVVKHTQPRYGVRLVRQPRSGVRVVLQPRSGVRVVRQPRFGVRVVRQRRYLATQPRSGVRLVRQPRSGVRVVRHPALAHVALRDIGVEAVLHNFSANIIGYGAEPRACQPRYLAWWTFAVAFSLIFFHHAHWLSHREFSVQVKLRRGVDRRCPTAVGPRVRRRRFVGSGHLC